MKERCYSSLDTHSQNRTFRASLLTANKFARNFVLFMNGRPLRPADLSNFYASIFKKSTFYFKNIRVT